jgi:tripartite-type tricarboxylate transporter receptor subunit TctC
VPARNDTPNTPTIAETYPGFAVMAMNALCGPSGIPSPVITKVSTDIRAIVESSAFKEKTKHLGIHTWGTTPQELDAWTRREIANWAKVAKAANIKVD